MARPVLKYFMNTIVAFDVAFMGDSIGGRQWHSIYATVTPYPEGDSIFKYVSNTRVWLAPKWANNLELYVPKAERSNEKRLTA